MFSKLRFALLIVTLGSLVFGCGREQADNTSPTKPTPPQASANSPKELQVTPPAAIATLSSLDGVTHANKPYKIVLIVKTRNNPFFTPMIAAFEKTAKELGAESEVQAPPQEMDTEKQFALVQTEISKGVQAICIAPADSKGIVPALKSALDKGIVVINLDNRVDAATARSQNTALGGYVGADNEAGGKLAGEAMLAALKGKGNVAILEGKRGVDNAEARKRGFTKAVSGKLIIAASEEAEWDTEKAYKKTQNILAAHPDIVGIFCANDKMAIGTMKAVEEAGKKGKITVIGYDNIPDVKPALASGAMAATIEQHPDSMGKYGVKMAVGILNGSIAKGGEILVPLDTIKK